MERERKRGERETKREKERGRKRGRQMFVVCVVVFVCQEEECEV